MNKEEKIPQGNNSSLDNSHSEYKDSADGVSKIKEELSKLPGEALYLRVIELIEQENLTRADWQQIDYQNNVYEKLMAEKFDIVKIKTLNAKWKASLGPKNDQEAEGSPRTASSKEELFYPGPIHIVEALKRKYRFRTIPEIGTDRENVYFHNSEIDERAEERIKEDAHNEYIRQWEEMRELAEQEGNKPLAEKLRNCLDHGPSVNDINEVLAMIRRTTFSYDEMNPASHIPFRNGLLNLKTRKLEPFTPDLFFTYQVNANILDGYVTLKDTPMFASLVNTAFYETDIPMVLSYSAYSLYPGLPVHKVLFIIGRERIGKGTNIRVLQGLMPKGSGSISLARLLTSDRFQFTGIEGKNLLVDSETKRKFKRGTIIEWSAFCNLFGKDVLSIEPKGKEAHDYVSKAKGIFLGNLPFIPVDSPPAVARMLVVQTRDERPRRVIPDLDRKILDAERDLIATLLVQVLFKLMDNDFRFPGEMTDDSTAMVLDQLADPVENFIEEETEYVEGGSVPVKDAYSRFVEWSESKGIPAMSRQTFVKRFGYTFQKKIIGPRGNREYFFVGCQLNEADIEVEAQGRLQVDHGVNAQESQKISLSGERYRRDQHVTHDPSCNEGKSDHDHDHACNVKVSGQKLITGLAVSTEADNKAPANIESVINLHGNSEEPLSENNRKSQPEPANSHVQSENSRFYRYRILKDFMMYGRVYRAGLTFALNDYLEDDLRKGNVELLEDKP
jgi:phage/plasmid-associated DNA primase